MSQKIVEGLYTKLTAATGAGTFYNALSGRIYELEAPQNASLPLAVVTLDTTGVDWSFAGDYHRSAIVSVELWGLRTAGAEALGDINQLLFTLLQGVDITVADHDRGHVTCLDEGSRYMDEDAINITSQWQIQASELV